MKTQLTAATVAVTISLLLGSGPLTAAESQFNAPATALAQESAQLLTQTARAFSGTQISDLWLYPTAEPDTVFAQYTMSATQRGASPTQHIALVTVRDNHVVGVRDLTDGSGGPHWSAAIGTGHASESAPDSGMTHGAPASPHWAAAIGTGSASQSSSPEVKSPVQSNQSVADAHWASKIGRGDASERSGRATKSPSPVVAGTTPSSAQSE